MALCARTALESLSAAGKDHLRAHGGLLQVIQSSDTPLFEGRSGPTRKADDTFVLVDRGLATAMCARLGLPRRSATTGISDYRV